MLQGMARMRERCMWGLMLVVADMCMRHRRPGEDSPRRRSRVAAGHRAAAAAAATFPMQTTWSLGTATDRWFSRATPASAAWRVACMAIRPGRRRPHPAQGPMACAVLWMSMGAWAAQKRHTIQGAEAAEVDGSALRLLQMLCEGVGAVDEGDRTSMPSPRSTLPGRGPATTRALRR